MNQINPPPPWVADVQFDDPAMRSIFKESALYESRHCGALGVEVSRIGQSKVWTRLRWREDLVGNVETGVLAGGALTTMLDHTSGVAVFIALGKLLPIVTLDLRIDYMRPAEPRRDVHCMGHCYKITRSMCFIHSWAYHDSEDDPIAAASATFIRVPSERMPFMAEAEARAAKAEGAA